MTEESEVSEGHRCDPLLSPYYCPICRVSGIRRRGVHFDHQYRCGNCDISWEPHAVVQFRLDQSLEKRRNPVKSQTTIGMIKLIDSMPVSKSNQLRSLHKKIDDLVIEAGDQASQLVLSLLLSEIVDRTEYSVSQKPGVH